MEITLLPCDDGHAPNKRLSWQHFYMQHISKQAIVDYPVLDMYKLVDDISSYPEFLPWCANITIHERSNEQVEASIVLKKGLINTAFTTRNTLQQPHEIEMNLVDGPFSTLHGVWRFKELSENSCKISLEMKFAISNPVLRLTLEPVFAQVLGRLVEAFKGRAEELYG